MKRVRWSVTITDSNLETVFSDALVGHFDIESLVAGRRADDRGIGWRVWWQPWGFIKACVIATMLFGVGCGYQHTVMRGPTTAELELPVRSDAQWVLDIVSEHIGRPYPVEPEIHMADSWHAVSELYGSDALAYTLVADGIIIMADGDLCTRDTGRLRAQTLAHELLHVHGYMHNDDSYTDNDWQAIAAPIDHAVEVYCDGH